MILLDKEPGGKIIHMDRVFAKLRPQCLSHLIDLAVGKRRKALFQSGTCKCEHLGWSVFQSSPRQKHGGVGERGCKGT